MFSSERDRILDEYPLLNAHGLGRTRLPGPAAASGGSGAREWRIVPGDLGAARDELRAGGAGENGMRNTLVYLAEARVALSYRLMGCSWARRFNGPAPPKRSSYALKHAVEGYLRATDEEKRREGADSGRVDRRTANGAFICAALMAGLRMWAYRGSVDPDFRLGEPWAVAGLRPEDFVRPEDERMARFWRWVARHEVGDPRVEKFVADTVDALYAGATLNDLAASVAGGGTQARDVYDRLRREYGIEVPSPTDSSRLGFMQGLIEIPDDFDRMGRDAIAEAFGVIG